MSKTQKFVAWAFSGKGWVDTKGIRKFLENAGIVDSLDCARD